MKTILLFIFNIKIINSEQFYKSHLRGLFNNEKNNFIESSVKIISDSIISHVIMNAKLNITQTTFDFSCDKHIIDKINKIKKDSTSLYLSLYPYLSHNDNRVIKYTQDITQQFSQKCYINFGSNNIHYPNYLSYQNIMTYDKGGINILSDKLYPRLSNYYTLLNLYNIMDDYIINLIITRLNETFPDITINYIDNDIDCCSYYLITW